MSRFREPQDPAFQALNASIDFDRRLWPHDIAQSRAPHNAANSTLVSALARLLAPVARQASALVATGGETAAAMMGQLGVHGLRLVDEIEPGIPLGLTLGEVSIPAVTKAGGFGNEECLTRIISRLRLIRQTGTVA